MATMYCALCRRPVEARRHIGVGTVALAFATGGLWLIAIPFYAKRCSICRSSAVSVAPPGGGAPESGDPSSRRLAELEQRLSFTQTELEATTSELDRVRTERDFYRKLLDDPTRRKGSDTP